MKNVLYDENSNIDLREFGIRIPVLQSRATKALNALLEDTELSRRKDEWLITEIPYTVGREDLERIHSPNYCASLFSEELENSLIKAFELVNPDGSFNRYAPQEAKKPLRNLFDQILCMMAGTYCAARIALEKGFCFYMGGGMHHGHRNFGHGFCPTNDIVAAARRLQYEKKAETIWIIDVDAHKGDGTAAITQDDDSIRTLSIHMAKGWPLHQTQYNEDSISKAVCIPSNIDIEIQRGEEFSYLERLSEGLGALERMSGRMEKPDLAIILLGADPYEKDELPSTENMQMTADDMLNRDKLIYHFLNDRSIPATYTMAGGYGHFSWEIYYRFLHWVLL